MPEEYGYSLKHGTDEEERWIAEQIEKYMEEYYETAV